MNQKWVSQHRGTKSDIKKGADYFRVGTELEVADPDAVCIHIYGVRKAEKAAHIVKCVNMHDELVEALRDLLTFVVTVEYQESPIVAFAEAALAKARGEVL